MLRFICWVVCLGFSVSIFSQPIEFALSKSSYSSINLDLERTLQADLGDDFRTADWDDLKAYVAAGGDIQALKGLEGSMLLRNGKAKYSGSRQYYIDWSDRDGDTPYDSFLSHDNIGQMHLGSWQVDLPILAVRKEQAASSEILLNIEEPAGGVVQSGVSNLRGWALAKDGVDRVELHIDGKYIADIPYGGERLDVGDAYSDYQDADYSGFSMALNYGLFNKGTASITLKVFDLNGDSYSKLVQFPVEKFNADFIADKNQIDLSAVSAVTPVDAQTIRLQGAKVAGVYWDVDLSWRTATQGFEFQKIQTGQAGVPPENTLLDFANGYWVSPDIGSSAALQIYVAAGSGTRQANVIGLLLDDNEFVQARAQASGNSIRFEHREAGVDARVRIDIDSASTGQFVFERCDGCSNFRTGQSLRIQKQF